MKDYLCEYQFNGATYGFTIKANSHAEAALRLMQIRDGWIAGEVKAAGDVNPDGARISGLETTAPAASGSPAAGFFDFEGHLAHQAMWSEATFGPGRRTAGVCDHIRKELVEVETDPEDANEWIDVVILALDGAWRAGLSPRQIINGIVTKQRRNEGRTWPDWRTADPNKAIEHDRAKDAPAAAPFTAEDWLCLAKGTEFEHYAGVSETKGILFREKAPAAEPVCNWVINEKRFFDVDPTIYYDTGCGSMFRYVYKQCQGCGKPISFKSEAAR